MNRILILIALAASGLAPRLGADPGNESFSHDDWNAVADEFVDDQGLVDYASLAGGRELLDRYLQDIETTGPESQPDLFATRNDKLAYYINAYNALVFKGVLDLPAGIETVWGKSKSGYGFFVKTKFELDGRRTNLRKLENEIVRARFEDPRIHAALNCASLGCPRLPRHAFDPDELDAQLDLEMTEFANESRNCEVDLAAGTVRLSKIFDWFRSDFEDYATPEGEAAGDLITYLNRYRPAEARIPDDLAIEFLKYDKRINRQSPPQVNDRRNRQEPLPAPFSAQQIRDAFQEGLEIVTRTWSPEGESLSRMTVEAWSEEGVTIADQPVDASGDLLDEKTVVETTWTQLRDHANFPSASATRERHAALTALGRLEGWLYLVDSDDGTRASFFFADRYPGPPVLYQAVKGEDVLYRAEQIERSSGQAPR